jgi:hypothetical protein
MLVECCLLFIKSIPSKLLPKLHVSSQFSHKTQISPQTNFLSSFSFRCFFASFLQKSPTNTEIFNEQLSTEFVFMLQTKNEKEEESSSLCNRKRKKENFQLLKERNDQKPMKEYQKFVAVLHDTEDETKKNRVID